MRSMLLSLAAVAVHGQELLVRSEFQRTGPDGRIVAADRSAPSREILSPPVARGGYASFHIVVLAPAGTGYTLYLGQNPDNATRATLYREIVEDGIPDKLERVTEPVRGVIPARANAVSYWLDLWVDRTAPVRRIKVEPQALFGDRWIVYPMEVRIVSRQYDVPKAVAGALPPPAERADQAILSAFCAEAGPPDTSLTVRSLIRRNAAQDGGLLAASWKCGDPLPQSREWFYTARVRALQGRVIR